MLVEAGIRDPELDDASFNPFGVWITLSRLKEGHDAGVDRKTASFPQVGGGWLRIDRERVSSVKQAGPSLLRIEFHDSFYLSFRST